MIESRIRPSHWISRPSLHSMAACSPSGHRREVVDQLHLAAADDVVDVAVEEALGMQGVLERNQEMQVLGIVPALRSAGGMPSWTQPTVKQSAGRRGPSRRRLGARGNHC